MARAQVLDVFVDESGNFGGGLAVFIDEHRGISTRERKLLTKQVGFEESVFVNDVEARNVSVFTPGGEISFAGQPLVGASWALSQRLSHSVKLLHCLGGEVDAWQADGCTWVSAQLDILPAWHLRQMSSISAVEAMTAARAAHLEHTILWAWADKPNGQVRARTFAIDWAIPEAETNGSGSMMLAAALGTEIEVRHGKGSIIYAKPINDTHSAVGGRVVHCRYIDVSV